VLNSGDKLPLHHNSLRQELSTKLHLQQYQRSEASSEMIAAGEPLENRFGIRFENFTVFPKDGLDTLHRPDPGEDLSGSVTIVSVTNPSIVEDVRVLSEIANSPPAAELSTGERRRYYESLMAIYKKLPFNYREASKDSKTLFVGIEREGRILAEAMGCLPIGHSLRPNTKRVLFEDGLEIGITGIPELPTYSRAIIIDGAIASGATLIAIIEKLRRYMPSFSIHSAHATWEGIRAICRYCSAEGIDVHVLVGHATAGLNEHFYAIQADNPERVVVGDLGDTISALEPH
jgi:hypothetical protein